MSSTSGRGGDAYYWSEVNRWLEAVQAQHARVIAARDEYWQITSEPCPVEDRLLWRGDRDCHFLLISARNLLRFAEKLRESNPEIEPTVDRFKARVANGVIFRDLFEHLDDYLSESPRRRHKDLNWPFGAEVGYSKDSITYGIDGRFTVTMNEIAAACSDFGDELRSLFN